MTWNDMDYSHAEVDALLLKPVSGTSLTRLLSKYPAGSST